MQSRARVKVGVWGRGTGKTTTLGIKHYNRFRTLPQACFFLISATYKQILNSSLPPMEEQWKKVGLHEYDFKAKSGHYVIGQKPPAHFEKPYKPPRHYEHMITFYNGYSVEMMSMDRPSPNRGRNFDGGDTDELALIDRDDLLKNIIPSIRGNKDKYGYNHPLHGQFSGFTSMPWLASGQWVLDFETMAAKDPETFYYSEATPHYNLRFLGPDWLELQEKILDPRIFRLEILNQRLVVAEDSFYYNFKESTHTYKPIVLYGDDPNGRGIIDTGTSDYNPDQLLDIPFDFGGWFTGALIFQQSHDRKDSALVTERMINSFYVQKGGSAEDVVDMICNHYSSHQMKYARLWGEPRGNDPSAHGQTLFEKVMHRFRKNGWQCENKVFQSQAHSHDRRYTYMNEMLAETHRHPKLRCNVYTCKAPIIAIQSVERTHDLKKDKSKERKRKFDQKHAPHFTDALDYYFMQKHYKARQGLGMEAWTA